MISSTSDLTTVVKATPTLKTDCHIDDVAAHDERFEFIQNLAHLLLLFFASSGPRRYTPRTIRCDTPLLDVKTHHIRFDVEKRRTVQHIDPSITQYILRTGQ